MRNFLLFTLFLLFTSCSTTSSITKTVKKTEEKVRTLNPTLKYIRKKVNSNKTQIV